MNPAYAVAGLVVGLLVGQTGMGGGSLMTPILVLLFGVHPSVAVGTDLLFASATKTAGTLVHGFNRTVDWRITARLAAGSIPATLLTLAVISHLDLASPMAARTISSVLAVMLLLTSVSLLFPKHSAAALAPALGEVSARRAAWLTTATGALLGVLVTISSVGAGALGVAALLVVYPRARLPVIVGSDIAHAVPLTLVAGLGHASIGSVDWAALGMLLAGSLPGVVIGSSLAARISPAVLRPILAVTLMAIGLRLLF